MDQGLIYHRELAAGGWNKLPFFAQMANIGSEISRACKWKAKEKPEMMQKAFERGLELLDLTISGTHGPKRHELLRAREVMCDFFAGENEYGSTPEQMQKYFDIFAYALAQNK